jgi:hypothetical protein
MQTTEGYFAELDAEKKRKMAEKGEYLCIVLADLYLPPHKGLV